MKKYWIIVASADHVAKAVEGGFIQACHGKKAPLARIQVGDQLLCYSPKYEFKGTKTLQAFTAIGEVTKGEPYQVAMTTEFDPYRRNVTFQPSFTPISIHPLLNNLTFIKNSTH